MFGHQSLFEVPLPVGNFGGVPAPVKGHLETSGLSSSWKLEYEIAVYDDILIVDFPDVYNNLPLKTKAMLEFAQSYCKDIEYFYFHDSGKFHPQSTKRGARIALG